MRFLIQHAVVYAGLVNSTWQPAGWTVACESLASGLPIVVYDGLVSRELIRIGACDTFMRSVSMNDIYSLKEALQYFVNIEDRHEVSKSAQCFAAESLDFGQTSLDFVMNIEKLVIQQ